MESHFELNDKEFEQQFEATRLDPKLFSHEAHLRLAWIHITRYGINNAIINITTQLKQYVQHLGAAEKYNETVTIAAIKAVHYFMSKSKTSGFKEFILHNSRLKTGFRELLNHHYTTDIFNSESAKKVFLEPELQPFTLETAIATDYTDLHGFNL